MHFSNTALSKKYVYSLLLACLFGLQSSQMHAMDYVRKMLAYASENVTKNQVLCAAAACTAVAYYNVAQSYKPMYFPWDKLPYKQTQQFPQGFLFGSGTSAHQVEGDCTNNSWGAKGAFEDLNLGKKDAHGEIPIAHKAGKACDHWNRYKEDIQLMKKIGLNSYRFSVEWSKIEPEKGKFCKDALDHYVDVCRELIKNDMHPCITLHHYTDPIWFVDAKGNYGFENEKNIQYYVRFATTVIKHIHDVLMQELTPAQKKLMPLYFTFNSPDGYAAQGYISCTKPAGRLKLSKDMQMGSLVYKNLLEAHVQTYHAIKADKKYAATQIGILKNMIPLDPYNIYNPLDWLACYMGAKMVDTPFFDYFTTGKFSVRIPTQVNVQHDNPAAIQALDFVGINYYSHGCMKNFGLTVHDNELKTNNPRYTLYPEGLYRAIKEVADKIGKPIYITENGIATDELADAKDAKSNAEPKDAQDIKANAEKSAKEQPKAGREEFLQKHLFVLKKAIDDGYDVRGYMYWSFMDNYEWGKYTKRYGLFQVDCAQGNLERRFKPSAQFYVDTIAANKKQQQ